MKLSIRKKIDFDWVNIMNFYKKNVTKESIVLEIGASTVQRTKELGKYCNKLIGIEYNIERKPKNFDNVEYFHGDWQKLTDVVQPGTIDIAIASHVIEHIPDDFAAINELYTVLKPGGVAFINTPNRKRLARRIIEVFTGERKFPYWEHIREYTETDFDSLLKKTLFKKYDILPVVFGLHGGKVYFYFEKVSKPFREFCNFWQVNLYK
ncbi:MAG: hypothetical protein A2536_02950 [Candidatus Firestonebacteria bacterium RIFOXYD2_FULL_39_29]|nr:MAG: hypothetical protein A2536_02950 [Candidatus Firestonebacteria bacterium RIFOXYD2_FULL_39_29]